VHGWTDPYEPRHTYRGQGGKQPYPVAGESSSPGRRAAVPDWPPPAAEPDWPSAAAEPDWPSTAAEEYGRGAPDWPYESEPLGPRRAAYRVAGPDLPNLAEDERTRQPRPLLLASIAAVATLLIIVGIGGLLLPSDDQGRPAAAIADGTTAAADPGAAGGAGAPSVLPSAAPSAPARTSAPASRSSRPPAQPSQVLSPPKRKATAPRPTRTTSASPPAPAASSPTSAPSSRPSGSAALQVVALVNQERSDAGCDPLEVDTRLATAAQRHSEDQAEHQTMSHDGSDGSTLAQRIDRVGYKWRTIGENVAYGQTTPTQVMDAWMNSAGHRQNIRNCDFEDIGVGVARDSDGRLYWTQDFGA
jgi:uncharacterized protein YkwD